MTTENNENEAIPCEPLPMEADLNDAQITFPVLKAGVYDCILAGARQHKNDEDKVIGYIPTFKLQQVAEAIDGREINPGFNLTKFITTVPSKKSPDWDWKQSMIDELAKIKKAITGESDGQWNIEELVGKSLRVRTKVGKNHKTGEPTTDVGQYLPPAE